MSTPKEPNFFSDDDIYARGMDWYENLFSDAESGDLKGEASTHYTKRLTYPKAVERLTSALPDVKLIYMMRHPIDRLVSHYVHEWTMNAAGDLADAVQKDTPYTDYSRYVHQLAPYIERYGRENILPVFLERLNNSPDDEFARIARFLGLGESAAWRHDFGALNVSKDRIKRIPFYDVLIGGETATRLRRAIAPEGLRNFFKRRLQMRERPSLSPEQHSSLARYFDDDLAELGEMLGVTLTCENFGDVVRAASLDWAAQD